MVARSGPLHSGRVRLGLLQLDVRLVIRTHECREMAARATEMRTFRLEETCAYGSMRRSNAERVQIVLSWGFCTDRGRCEYVNGLRCFLRSRYRTTAQGPAR